MPNEIYRKRKVRKRKYEWIDDTPRSGQKIDQNRHLLILTARFDGFKKNRHSNLQPSQEG